MDWSARSATKAYLDSLKLCNNFEPRCNKGKLPEPGSNEFISALAAGTKAERMIEVTSDASPVTLALAAAARQTGGKLVCILPEHLLDESKKVIENSGLNDMVEFKTGNPFEELPRYPDIDFAVVDCKGEDNTRLLNLIDVHPKKSVVVANNLVSKKNGLGGYIEGKKDNISVRSTKNPIGEGMEITIIGDPEEMAKVELGVRRRSSMIKRSKSMKKPGKSKWILKIDKETGEEHIYRISSPYG